MGEQLEKFDPATLTQGVKDRIKATFVSLIPDEQWDQMVQNEVNTFFNVRRPAYNSRDISDFQSVCSSTIREECIARLKTYFSTREFEATWTEKGVPVLQEGLKKTIVDNAGAMLVSIMTEPIQRILDGMKYR